MKLLHKIIRAIERNSRANERHKLTKELEDLQIGKHEDTPRIRQIIERLNVLGREDLNSYLERNKSVKSVSQQIQEDDCGVPDGLVVEWKAPV